MHIPTYQLRGGLASPLLTSVRPKAHPEPCRVFEKRTLCNLFYFFILRSVYFVEHHHLAKETKKTIVAVVFKCFAAKNLRKPRETLVTKAE